jgi:hypothetical protein
MPLLLSELSCSLGAALAEMLPWGRWMQEGDASVEFVCDPAGHLRFGKKTFTHKVVGGKLAHQVMKRLHRDPL